MLTDPVGNVLPTAYEVSIMGQTTVAGSKIGTAIWKLSHASLKSRTKAEMRAEIEEAVELLMDAKELIDGRRT